jgi:hypothetical protein
VKASTKALLVVAAKSTLAVIRFCLYVLLLLVGRILLPVTGVATVAGTMVFLFCALLRPDLRIPMWSGVGLAIAATIVSVFYDAALRLVAPEGTTFVRDV